MAISGSLQAQAVPKIAFEKYTLPNGLEVILHEDHSTPIVAVNIWYKNVPYGKSEEIILAALYPKGHPYSWSAIGSMDDLSAASLDDVKNFRT